MDFSSLLLLHNVLINAFLKNIEVIKMFIKELIDDFALIEDKYDEFLLRKIKLAKHWMDQQGVV